MNHMMKQAEILRPKFEAVEEILDNELSGLGIGTWTKPLGGYFISFDAMPGCAKAIVKKCKEAGMAWLLQVPEQHIHMEMTLKILISE